IKTLDDLADLATDELVQRKRPEQRRQREPSNRPEDKGGILADFALSDEQGNEIIMAARAHWFEEDAAKPASGDGPQQQEDAVAETEQ
ncbi:MAG: transcription termination/antitermination protein NusA, partial [Geminicoccaceae bacterium]